MLKNTRIAFVGAGAMGGAMISGLLSRKLVASGDIVASDPNREITEGLYQTHGVDVSTDNVAACEGADIVVLSVKPQVLPQVFSGLAGSKGYRESRTTKPKAFQKALLERYVGLPHCFGDTLFANET